MKLLREDLDLLGITLLSKGQNLFHVLLQQFFHTLGYDGFEDGKADAAPEVGGVIDVHLAERVGGLS